VIVAELATLAASSAYQGKNKKLPSRRVLHLALGSPCFKEASGWVARKNCAKRRMAAN
jgi:hypothetical protein